MISKAAERLRPIPRLSKEEKQKRTEELREKNRLEEMKRNVDGEHMFENASLEDYEKAEENETKAEFSDTDREEMTREIVDLRNEVEFLRGENFRLKSELEDVRTRETPPAPRIQCDFEEMEKMEELKARNVEMCRINSELEKQIDILRETGIMQQREIDSMRHSYTRSGYDPRMTVVGNGTSTNMNGYQDWR